MQDTKEEFNKYTEILNKSSEILETKSSITQIKKTRLRAGRVAQVAVYLPSKPEDLNSNSIPEKKNTSVESLANRMEK
jgi:hypothetical protein